MATLTGKKINTTYDGLLKTEDNQPISTTKKKVTDGYGNETGLSVDSLGNVDVSDDLNVLGNAVVTGSTTANSFIKTGGTSSQFLKADGSLDSNTYITSSTDTLDSVTDRGNSTTNSITVNGLTATTATVDSLEIQFGLRDQANSLGTNGQVLTSTGTGTDWKSTSELGLIDGSGTANYIAKWTDGDTIGNSVIYDNGSNVGIGTASPASKLEVISGASHGTGFTQTRSGHPSFSVLNGGTNSVSFGIAPDGGSYNTFIQATEDGTDIDFIRFNTASQSERMRIDSVGDISFRDTSANEAFYWDASTARLGIGTTSPSAKMHIYNGEAIIATNTDGLKLSYSAGNSSGVIDTAFSDNNLEFRTNGNTKMWIANNGNVGIGTSSPSYKLDVSGVSRFTDGFYLDQATAGTNASIYLGSDQTLELEAFGANGEIAFSVGSSISEAMRITSAGNVGIGTSSAVAALNVKGETVIQETSGGNAALRVQYGVDGNTALRDRARLMSVGYHGKMELINGFNEHTVTISSTGDSYLNGGNVGIGTSSPQLNTKLHISNSGAEGLEFQVAQSSNINRILSYNRSATAYNTLRVDGLEHQFLTSGSEKMRITSGGEIRTYFSTVFGQVHRYTGSTANVYPIVFEYGLGTKGSISMTTSGVSYNTISDYRLKENVIPLTNALDRVDALKPSRFNFISDANKTVDGFLAHEVQDIVPEAISGEKDATEEYEIPAVLDEEGNVIEEAVMGTRDVYQGIDQSKIVPLLVAAIQELKAEIELLKTK